jgi:hypothetical protein
MARNHGKQSRMKSTESLVMIAPKHTYEFELVNVLHSGRLVSFFYRNSGSFSTFFYF